MTSPTITTVQSGKPPGQSSLQLKALKRFSRHKLAMFGTVALILIVLLTLFAPFITQHSPSNIDLLNRSQGPSLEHPLGTDATGRDVLARTLYGGRVSLAVGLVAVTLSTLIGVLIGSLSGYFRGRVDMVLMRFTDMVMTFPQLVIVIALVAVLGPSMFNTMFALGLLGWPTTARLVRSEFLRLREQDFVVAAQSLGARSGLVIFKHILPNVVGPLIVAITLGVADAILIEASLSFLGLGVQIPTPSWGNMLQSAQSLTTLQTLPWLWLSPGIMIVLTVLSINFIGDGLRDALDPKAVL